MESESGQECAILERMFLSIVMTETDEQFETCLHKFLPYVLKKSGSPHTDVRTKVVEVLSHVSKRVRGTKSIVLPVETLLNIYADPNASSFQTNFTIIYIKMGFQRLKHDERIKLLPQLIQVCKNRPVQHQESLCLLFLTNLKNYPYPKDRTERANVFNLKELPHIRKLILDIIMDVMLFPYGCTGQDNLTNISVESFNRLTRDDLVELNGDYFEQFKITLVQFLGMLDSTDVYPHLVVASADDRSAVSELAESQLKQLPDINYNDLNIVAPLYALFLKVGTNGSMITSLNPRTRLKLLQNMSRFQAVVWPAAMRVLFESLYGSFTTPKLRNHALNFASSMIRNLSQDRIEQVWPVLLNAGIMKLLEEEMDRKNKILALQILPLLILKCSDLAKKDLSPIEFVFSTIENEEDPDLTSAARDAAYSMARGYKGIMPDQEKLLYSLLTTKLFPLSSVKSVTGQQLEGMRASRMAAVRFISEACSHSPLKVYTLLNATVLGDEDSCAEATKALYLTTKSKRCEQEEFVSSLVEFDKLLTLVLAKEKITPHSFTVLNAIVNYLRLSLAKETSQVGELSSVIHPSEASPLVRKKLENYNSADPELLPLYLNLLVKSLQTEPGVPCLSAIFELVGCLPEVLSNHLLNKLHTFLELVTTHTREEVRILCAKISALITPEDLAPKTLQKCVENIRTGGKDIEKIHGSIYLFGFIAARHGGATKEGVNALIEFLTHSYLQNATVTSLGHASETEPLPLDQDDFEKLVDTLLNMTLDLKLTPKLKDRICTTLCSFCTVEMDFQFKQVIIEKLMGSLRQFKDVDLCLSTSEVVCSAVLGKASTLSLNPWFRDADSIEKFKDELVKGGSLTPAAEKACLSLETTFSKILTMLNTDRHPNTRQALCFWLLNLVKQCSFLPIVEKWLTDIQNGFIDLLADSNDLVQEGAGKGLAFVYEATQDEEMKSMLLKVVIEQITLGRKSVVKVSDDTKLFQPDELGETPTGGKLSTYKELCQLASDLNQPDLIYKFMQLANHNSVWNSKKGAAYTISSLISKAGDQLEGQLPKVLVKLYRYQYDPMPNIQRSMSDIWSSLASPDTVEKYYLEIFNDLLENLTNVAWRVRISCSAAMQDFIRRPAWNKITENHPEKVGELWSQLIRVMDDIHEGTRNSAVSTSKILSKICIREAKEGGKAGKKLAGNVLKLLLNSGIKSTVSEIRAISVSTVSEMVKEGLPKEDAPVIIVNLLKSCADLDLANIYVPGNSAAETLDKIRIPLLKSNHVVQAILACLPYVDADMASQLHSDLVDLLKPSAGFGTRIVTAHFIVLMSHHLTKEEFQPLVGKFLGSLLSGLTDRSPGIRKQFASSIGQLLRSAKDSSIERLLERIKNLYFEKEDEGVRKAICHTIQAISAHSQDSVKDKEDLILPLIFFAKHVESLPDGSNKSEVEDWNEVWNDLAYTNNVLLNNEDKVVELLKSVAESQSWKTKAQMSRAARTLGLREGLSNEKRLELTRLLIASLPGRTWDGKENVLHALSAMVKDPKAIKEAGVEQELIESILKECKKEKSDYKIHAFVALGDVAEALNADIFEEAYSLLKDIILRRDELDNGDKEEKSDSKLKLLETSYDTLGKCWPRNISTQRIHIEEVLNNTIEKLVSSTSRVQVSIVACLCSVISKTRDFLRDGDPIVVGKILEKLMQAMDYCFNLPKNTRLKKEALNLLQSLQITFRGRNEKEYQHLQEFFERFSATLANETAPELRSRFTDIKEMFRTETLMS
ncbi:proteasome-associated protein ECM29 homolog [Cimex lectularius]|uniref:Proteasome-associated protein ECM29 homolog n=1 Tax=Cimex lectularius TaxID=79782 RepID=A0A8I6RTU4_CIMLE|nr:proteasome-associated protein ECM29 homolog [Cimex lectularius]